MENEIEGTVTIPLSEYKKMINVYENYTNKEFLIEYLNNNMDIHHILLERKHTELKEYFDKRLENETKIYHKHLIDENLKLTQDYNKTKINHKQLIDENSKLTEDYNELYKHTTQFLRNIKHSNIFKLILYRKAFKYIVIGAYNPIDELKEKNNYFNK